LKKQKVILYFIVYSCLIIGIWIIGRFYYSSSIFVLLITLSFWLGYGIESHLVIRASGSLTTPTIFGAAYIVPVVAGAAARAVEWTLGLSVVLYAVLLARVLWYFLRHQPKTTHREPEGSPK
jgi:hypothetical protein